MSHGTRGDIKRARREGVQVEKVDADAESLAMFCSLYHATMHRRGAAQRWFFPPSYFESCVRRLGPQRSALFFARCDGTVAAAFLLLNDEQTAYYHFAGSDEGWRDRRPNHLLMYETMLWAKRRGLSRYHLGGGVSANENDSLLWFKSAFGGYKTVLHTYCRILHDGAYRELCALKAQYEERAPQVIADPDYFPLYRR